MKIDLKKDLWLEGILGVPVFKVTLPDGRRPQGGSLGRMKAGFYYSKVPTGAVGQVQFLLKNNFYVADVNVVLERKLDRSYRCRRNISISVREARLSDAPSVLKIAATSFRYSRFHQDPQIPKTMANEVKKQWVLNSLLKKRGDSIYVAVRNGAIAGFLSTIILPLNGGPVSFIDLIAVSPHCYRKGVGEVLVQEYLKRSSKSMKRVRVGTQVANVPSLRLYEKCGFHIAESQFVLHAHVGKSMRGR